MVSSAVGSLPLPGRLWPGLTLAIVCISGVNQRMGPVCICMCLLVSQPFNFFFFFKKSALVQMNALTLVLLVEDSEYSVDLSSSNSGHPF